MFVANDKEYESYTNRSLITLRCDYCDTLFQRLKKSRERLNTIVAKDSCGAKACTQAKREEVFALRYGDKNLFKSDAFKDKQANTNLAKYGQQVYLQSEDFQNKRRETMIDRYGVASPLQSPELRNKIEDTCEERYGVRNIATAEDFSEKRAVNNIKKYGVASPMMLDEIKAKKIETCQQVYGVDNYAQTDEFKESVKNTCIERYGVEHPSQLPENRQKAKATCMEKYGVNNYAQTNEFKQKYTKTCLSRYGVPNPLLLPANQVYGKTQKEIQDWLNSLGFAFKQDYTLLPGKEIDLYDANTKTAIEYCGLFWHNERSLSPRGSQYHFEKYNTCAKAKVQLITIFEDEWINRRQQCEAVLKANLGVFDRKYFARKCNIEQIDKDTAKTFLNEYHLQGTATHSIVRFGMVHDKEVIGMMSLGRHHRQKMDNKTIILDRLCFVAGVQIVGGASRLLAACRKWANDNGFVKIITWSDNRWSTGKVYEKLGFHTDEDLKPDYSYVDMKRPGVRISKQSQMKRLTGCPIEITEHEWAAKSGLARIWDCGKKRWILTIGH